MEIYVTTKDISNAMGITTRAVQKKAEAKLWPSIMAKPPARGKPYKLFPLSSLPRELRSRIIESLPIRCGLCRLGTDAAEKERTISML